MIETMLDGLLPVAFVIGLGWLSVRLKIFKHKDADIFALLVLRFALPLALFEGALKTPPDQLSSIPFALCLLFGLMGTYLFALAVGLFVFKNDLRASTMQALVCAFPDMAYFGAPVLAAVFGPEGFLAVLVGNLVTSLFMLPLTIILVRISDKTDAAHGQESIGRVFAQSLLAAVTNPIVWLPILGAILSFRHVALPHPVMESVDMIAKAAGGTSLFALGLMLSGEPLRLNANVIANIGMKNFLQPALMWLGVVALGMHGAPAQQVIITGAVPTATAASMFALKNRSYTSEATSTILVSTVLGLFTEAALIALFAR